jgi:hypothetical protein
MVEHKLGICEVLGSIKKKTRGMEQKRELTCVSVIKKEQFIHGKSSTARLHLDLWEDFVFN